MKTYNGKRLKKIFTSSQFFVAMIILLLGVIIQVRSGQFFTGNNMLDILRAMVVPGIFAMGTMMIIISGGTDVSFPAIASLALAMTTTWMKNIEYSGSILVVFLISGVIGMLLGFINGVLVGVYGIPTLIASLGTVSLCTGYMLGFMGAHEIAVLPPSMAAVSKTMMLTSYSETLGMTSHLPAVFLVLPLVVAATWFILRKTYIGRSIFAIGGDIQAARRVGFNVIFSQMFLYGYAGLLAGIAGITRVLLTGQCYPQNLLGSELSVIAAVVLGGTRITGGVGTITGSLLGVALFAIINNSLQLIGIPSYWQKAFIGTVIILGTGLTAYQVLRKSRETHVDLLDD